jgi:hypothetical protein
MPDHFVDPPATTWQVGDIVTLGDDEGVTRCRVKEITARVDENGQPYRSFVFDEISTRSR